MSEENGAEMIVFSISEQEIKDAELPDDFTARDYSGDDVAKLIRKYICDFNTLDYIALCLETPEWVGVLDIAVESS